MPLAESITEASRCHGVVGSVSTMWTCGRIQATCGSPFGTVNHWKSTDFE
ncbi:Uncharacterised protein [Mycobacteroides abscessus subsp. abscessus]|nr:Uncharacterised protein [Mycobacteroides abscessus subsp. abscessus]